MREFIVTLRCGIRYTIKADRVRHEQGYLALVLTRVCAVSDPEDHEVIALFEQGQVAVVVARDQLVSEEKGEPIKGPFYVGASRDSDVPF